MAPVPAQGAKMRRRYYVYIMTNRTGTLYIGVTNEVERGRHQGLPALRPQDGDGRGQDHGDEHVAGGGEGGPLQHDFIGYDSINACISALAI